MQRLPGIFYTYEIRQRKFRKRNSIAYHEIAHPPGIQAGDILVPVAALAHHGDKQGSIRVDQLPAVEQQVLYLRAAITLDEASFQDLTNAFNTISHKTIFSFSDATWKIPLKPGDRPRSRTMTSIPGSQYAISPPAFSTR